MEEDYQDQIEWDSLKAIPNALIENFITQIRSQKPHLQVSLDSLQFVKAKRKDLKYYENQANIEDGQDRFGDVFTTSELQTRHYQCGSFLETNLIDTIKWVYFLVFDEQCNLHKTLKVEFIELFGNKTLQFQKELMSQKIRITSFHNGSTCKLQYEHRNLILQIYDYYFLSINEESPPLYFVVEQEHVHSTYKQSQNKLLNRENDIKFHKQKCLDHFKKEMGFKVGLDLLNPLASFYVTFNHDKSLSLKLSPLDFYPLFSQLNSDSGMISEEQTNNQRLYQIQENTLLLQNKCESIDTIQLDLSQDCCPKKEETLITYLNRNNPQVFELHDIELLEVLSLHPSFKNVELEVYNRNMIQFRQTISGSQFLLTCVKYENHFEAERILYQFQLLFSFEFFHPESACEIIPLHNSLTYLLFIEVDFSLCTNLNQNNKLQSNTKKAQVLLCWLINKLVKIQQEKIEVSIFVDYHIVEFQNINGNSSFFFKELFTFQYIYPAQSKLERIKKGSISTLLLQSCRHNQPSQNNVLISELSTYIKEQTLAKNQRKQISHYPNLYKAFKVISKLIEMDDKYEKSCEINFNNFKIWLKDSDSLPKEEFQNLLSDYDDIWIYCSSKFNEILEKLEKLTQVKQVNLLKDPIDLSKCLDNFSFVFPNLEKLYITTRISKIFKIINIFQIQKLIKLRILYFDLTQTQTINEQSIEENDVWLLNNFIEVVKIKTLKSLRINYPLFFGVIYYNKNVLNYYQYLTKNDDSISPKISQVHNQQRNECQLITQYNIMSLLNCGLSYQVQKLNQDFPWLSYEIHQNCSETSINVIQFDNNEKSILLTIHFKNNKNNLKETFDSETFISFETKYEKRFTSSCSLIQLKKENLYEIIKECVYYESYKKKMKLWFNYDEDQGNCEHGNLNQFVIQFQANFQVLKIHHRLCEQIIKSMNSNSNYLGLQSNKFRQLFTINIKFIDHEMTKEALQGLFKNIRKCKRAYQLKFCCYERPENIPKKQLIQFLKTPHLIKFKFYNKQDSSSDFIY